MQTPDNNYFVHNFQFTADADKEMTPQLDLRPPPSLDPESPRPLKFFMCCILLEK